MNTFTRKWIRPGWYYRVAYYYEYTEYTVVWLRRIWSFSRSGVHFNGYKRLFYRKHCNYFDWKSPSYFWSSWLKLSFGSESMRGLIDPSSQSNSSHSRTALHIPTCDAHPTTVRMVIISPRARTTTWQPNVQDSQHHPRDLPAAARCARFFLEPSVAR